MFVHKVMQKHKGQNIYSWTSHCRLPEDVPFNVGLEDE